MGGCSQSLRAIRSWHLGCLLSKQTNATSFTLNGLLTDMDSIRQTTLQNRAAINFLLLAQSHGCEELNGMCCMNLSDNRHNPSEHPAIKKWSQEDDRRGWHKLVIGTLQKVRVEGMVIISSQNRIVNCCYSFVVLLLFLCLWECLGRSFKEVFIVKQKGGDGWSLD